MDKKRILFLAPAFAPEKGGVEQHLLELSRTLRDRGYRLTVITRTPLSCQTPAAEGENPLILRLPAPPGRRKVWPWLWSHRALFREASLVHCHDFSAFWGWYLPYRFLWPDKKVYVTFHGWEGRYPISRKTVFYRKVTEKCCRGNICVGDFISRWYGTRPSAVTYGGVALPAEQRSRPMQGRALFIGRLENDTGWPIYLQALEELWREHKLQLELAVCGQGSLEQSSRRHCADQGLPVRFLGHVDNLDDEIQSSSMVLTTGYLSLLACFANQRPVVTVYDNPVKRDYLIMMPQAREMLEIAGGLAELKASILRLMQDAETVQAKVAAAYAWAKEQTWEKVADTYEQLWQI